MQVTLQPTQEVCPLTINGATIPFRVWHGEIVGGVKIEAYVLSIVPAEDSDEARAAMQSALPPFMVPSHQAFTIGGIQTLAERLAVGAPPL